MLLTVTLVFNQGYNLATRLVVQWDGTGFDWNFAPTSAEMQVLWPQNAIL